MATKPRLTLASMWAFEDIGAQEVQEEFKKLDNQDDLLCEYSKTDDVLVIKGNLETSASKYASLMSDFVEDQKNKDLLDMPRIRQLEIPSTFDDDMIPAAVAVEKEQEGDLLALDDGSDEEFIPLSAIHTTKFWTSSSGGLGCFAANFHEVLGEVATMTGTEISIIDDTKGLQISGKNPGDVNDALTKLTCIEKPLVLMNSPCVSNMIIASEDEELRVRIQNYISLNSVALRRILVDPNLSSNTNLFQAFVTVLLAFDTEAQSFTEPTALLDPPHTRNEPGRSRIWNDFTFQEIGKGDEFLSMESIVEKDSANPQAVASGIAPPHPYLSAEKAKRVNQWVVEGVEMKGEPESEPNRLPLLEPIREPSEPTQGTKKPSGIRTRKPAQVAKDKATMPAKVPIKQPASAKAPVPESNEEVSTPRRRWKMSYGSDPDSLQKSMRDKANNTDLNTGLESIAGIPRDISTLERSQTPESRNRMPTDFDETKYGLKRTSKHGTKHVRNISNFSNIGEQLPTPPKSGLGKKNELIDVITPTVNLTSYSPSLISFDQPALIPQKPSSSYFPDLENPSQEHLLSMGKGSADLIGLEFENGFVSDSDGPASFLDTRSSNKENLPGPDQGKRLTFLKRILDDQKKEMALTDRIGSSKSQRDVSRELCRERLARLENAYKSEEKQSIDEATTREFHRTMFHRMAKPSEKGKSKAEIKAKRQATLEDAWGIFKKPLKKPAMNVPKQSVTVDGKSNETPRETDEPKKRPMSTTTPTAHKDSQQVQGEAYVNRNILSLFESLKPVLDAAQCFPGSLNLEAQMGLILIPLLPKSYGEGLISLNEWTKIFQPRNGLPAPTTKFINRLTTSGSDVDHMVDLKTSKAEGKRRLFEQEYTEYGVFYEYHCRTNADQLFIVTIDEQGKYTIRKPVTTLGTVNLHFPRQTWDASLIVSGVTEYVTGSDLELEEAVRYLIDNLWVQPDKSLIRIFTRLPKGNKLVIEKVFMKRWTRHRYIRSGDTISKGTTGTVSSAKNSSTIATTNSKIDGNNEDQNSVANESESNENQDIYLQIMEVQDLLVGSSSSDTQAVRARCASLPDMVKTGRQWYEASLISSAIETMLKSNANVEVGECTDDWYSSDLLGEDAVLLSSSETDSSPFPPPLSSVAAAIGVGGLGHLFRLTKTVVEKIDGIGFWNCGPGVEAARMAAAIAAGPLPSGPAASGTGPVAKLEKKGMEFDDLESIKEVGSVIMNAPVKSHAASSVAVDQGELEYW